MVLRLALILRSPLSAPTVVLAARYTAAAPDLPPPLVRFGLWIWQLLPLASLEIPAILAISVRVSLPHQLTLLMAPSQMERMKLELPVLGMAALRYLPVFLILFRQLVPASRVTRPSVVWSELR